MTPPAELTWTCHVCGRRRPDALIAVHSREVDYPGGIKARENVRHCADRQACMNGAREIRWLPEAAT